MSDLDSIVDRLVEAQYSKESPVQIANMHDRIAELEAENAELTRRLHDLVHVGGRYKELRKAWQEIEKLKEQMP